MFSLSMLWKFPPTERVLICSLELNKKVSRALSFSLPAAEQCKLLKWVFFHSNIVGGMCREQFASSRAASKTRFYALLHKEIDINLYMNVFWTRSRCTLTHTTKDNGNGKQTSSALIRDEFERKALLLSHWAEFTYQKLEKIKSLCTTAVSSSSGRETAFFSSAAHKLLRTNCPKEYWSLKCPHTYLFF